MFLGRSLESYINEFEKKEAKYEDAYQTSGAQSSLKTREKYSDLLEICYAARRETQEEDEMRMRKQKQASEYIGTVKDRKLYSSEKSYTLDELVEELETLARIIC